MENQDKDKMDELIKLVRSIDDKLQYMRGWIIGILIATGITAFYILKVARVF